MRLDHPQTERLSAYLDRDLPEQELQEVKRHVDVCEVCRLELEGLEQMLTDFRSLPELNAPSGFLREVMEKVEAKERRSFWSLLRRWKLTPVLAPLAVAATVMVMLRSPDVDKIPMPAVDYAEKSARQSQMYKDGSAPVLDGATQVQKSRSSSESGSESSRQVLEPGEGSESELESSKQIHEPLNASDIESESSGRISNSRKSSESLSYGSSGYKAGLGARASLNERDASSLEDRGEPAQAGRSAELDMRSRRPAAFKGDAAGPAGAPSERGRVRYLPPQPQKDKKIPIGKVPLQPKEIPPAPAPETTSTLIESPRRAFKPERPKAKRPAAEEQGEDASSSEAGELGVLRKAAPDGSPGSTETGKAAPYDSNGGAAYGGVGSSGSLLGAASGGVDTAGGAGGAGSGRAGTHGSSSGAGSGRAGTYGSSSGAASGGAGTYGSSSGAASGGAGKAEGTSHTTRRRDLGDFAPAPPGEAPRASAQSNTGVRPSTEEDHTNIGGDDSVAQSAMDGEATRVKSEETEARAIPEPSDAATSASSRREESPPAKPRSVLSEEGVKDDSDAPELRVRSRARKSASKKAQAPSALPAASSDAPSSSPVVGNSAKEKPDADRMARDSLAERMARLELAEQKEDVAEVAESSASSNRKSPRGGRAAPRILANRAPDAVVVLEYEPNLSAQIKKIIRELKGRSLAPVSLSNGKTRIKAALPEGAYSRLIKRLGKIGTFGATPPTPPRGHLEQVWIEINPPS